MAAQRKALLARFPDAAGTIRLYMPATLGYKLGFAVGTLLRFAVAVLVIDSWEVEVETVRLLRERLTRKAPETPPVRPSCAPLDARNVTIPDDD